jgi:hypothetical protein
MGCTCSSSKPAKPSDRPQVRRVGNFTFCQHGKLHSDGTTVGEGCKKAPKWSTTSTKAEVDRRIEEFWGTRVEGNPEVWKLLQLACSAVDPSDAAEICRAGGLQLVKETLLFTQDRSGRVYELPPYVIHPALEYGQETRKPETVTSKPKDLVLKLRSVKFPDTEFACTTGTLCSEIKEYCETKHSISKHKLKCFYGGRELRDDSRLQHHGIKDTEIITVMCLS